MSPVAFSKSREVVSGLVFAAVAFGLTACGSDSDGGGTPPSSAAGKALLAEAQQSVADLSKAPTDIGIQEPLKDPESLKGKTFVYMSCAAPICQLYGPDLEEATAALGVTLETINTGGTPDSINSAWNQLASMSPKPAAVIAPANPTELFSAQLEQLVAGGTKVVLFNTPDPVPDGVDAVVFPPADSSTLGSATADFIFADAEGDPGRTLYITTPVYAALQGGPKSYTARMKELCGCEVDTLNVQPTEIGQSIPSKVVSFLQAHPDVKYVVPQFGDLEIGVPQAITGAGLDLPKLVTAEAEPANLQMLKDGLEYADAAHFLDYLFWVAADSAARAVLEQEITVPAAPIQWLLRDDLTFDLEDEHPPFGVDFRAEFEKLWAGQ